MKVRNGFVSNSSSSSFLIYGLNLEDISYELENEISNGLKDTDLDTYRAPYGDCFVGASWDSVGDNETGAQFKARVASTTLECLSKVTLTKKVYKEDFGTHEAAWYDG